ncbi:MAG: hypothetical protein ABFC67_10970 [Mizugakiibacter sp.]|uniref:DUF6969 family protein n=1 Tax=Mizugakiibacter sp. TaxID=1972610 RepID=UPI0031C60870|nr:hypothetical protein [Xanthomonadaceae bacterium]
MTMPAPRADADSPYLHFPRVRIARRLRMLDRTRRARAYAAAGTLVDSLKAFVGAGHAPLAALVDDGAAPEAWRHYRSAGAAGRLEGKPGGLHYYYHAHAAAGTPRGEHGHFHLFARLDPAADGAPRYAHLVAIGVDARGLPLRLFTTQRWVTDETWLPAARVIALAERIAAAPAARTDPVEGWLRAQLGVFAPQIAALLRHRDRRIAARRRGGRRPGLSEDRRMYVLSQCRVSVEDQLAALDRVFH